MLVVACIKQVPDTTQVQIDPVTNTLAVEAPLPVMLTVVRELNRPRYPTVPMRLESRDAVVKVSSNRELQLDEQTLGRKGSPTWVSRTFSPEREKGEIIGEDVSDPIGLRGSPIWVSRIFSPEREKGESIGEDKQAGQTRVWDIAELVAEGLR
jgi:electron transfer flavoprotein alpha/beta subunit